MRERVFSVEAQRPLRAFLPSLLPAAEFVQSLTTLITRYVVLVALFELGDSCIDVIRAFAVPLLLRSPLAPPPRPPSERERGGERESCWRVDVQHC